MAETFGDLGLRPELLEAVDAAGYTEPTPLQGGAIPVIRRGGNVVLHGSPGAGVLAAYGLALLDRLSTAGAERESEADPASPGALVLVPTTDEASRSAESLGRFGERIGLLVLAAAPGWTAPEGGEILFASPDLALGAVKASALKLDGLQALVVDGASALLRMGAREALEVLAASAPKTAQRVVVSAALTAEVEQWVERHVRRPLHVPARSAVEEERPSREPARPLEYAVVRDTGKLEALAAILAPGRGTAGAPATVHCRTARRAADMTDALRRRGFQVEPGPSAHTVAVRAAAAADSRLAALTLSYDVPFDPVQLEARHPEGGLVLATARELPHLQRVAGDAGYQLTARRVVLPSAWDQDLTRFRDRIRAAAAQEDLAAQLLVLEPLFETLSPAEVAAAASALLRRRAAAAEPSRESVRPRAAPAEEAPRTWARLFLSAGSRDGIRPGDLLGAITGEARLAGEQVGRIEIRDTFSIVDVAAESADRVIQALNGTTLRGRSLRVDYDRRASGSGARRGGR